MRFCENCIDEPYCGQFTGHFFVHFYENTGKEEKEKIHIDKTGPMRYYKLNLFINRINK